MTPWTVACQAHLCSTVSPCLLKFMSIESVMLSKHLTFCYRSLLLPSIFPSIRVFPSELALCLKWPKYWNLNFSNYPSSEYSRLISFKFNWFDLLAVQGTLKNLLQHHNLKASILQRSAFFMDQLQMVVIIITLQIPGSKETWSLCCTKEGRLRRQKDKTHRSVFRMGFTHLHLKIPDGKTCLLLPFPVLQFIFFQSA